MEIAPSSNIEFFPDIGLSPNQENTFYFASTAAKDLYFTNLTQLARAENCSYVRNEPYKIRVAIPIATLQYAGYMRYKNPSFGNKWYYAFVTNAEYINNEVTEITFTRDIVQTWMGEFELGQCLVEREHTPTDEIGEHLIDEDLACGDYKTVGQETISTFNPVLLLNSSVEKSGGTLVAVKGKQYRGYMISGSAYIHFAMTNGSDAADAIQFISDIIDDNKQDAITSIRIVPAYCIPKPLANDADALPLDTWSGGEFISSYTWSSLDGYQPKNKKMLSYPYITCEVINGEGGSVEYRPEMFQTKLVPHFVYRGVSFDVCEVICFPVGYKGQAANYEESIMMRDFPQASFDVDQYKAYVAQMTSGGGWLNVIGSVAQSTAGGLLHGGLAGAGAGMVSSGLSQIFQLMQNEIYYNSIPPAVKGTANANIMSAMGAKRFFLYHKSVLADRAKAIDDFFTMFGYKVNTVKAPILNNRPEFTYIKTVGCIVHGNLPSSDAEEIEKIFDRGIRFWIDPTHIGNYSYNNAPAAEP